MLYILPEEVHKDCAFYFFSLTDLETSNDLSKNGQTKNLKITFYADNPNDVKGVFDQIINVPIEKMELIDKLKPI